MGKTWTRKVYDCWYSAFSSIELLKQISWPGLSWLSGYFYYLKCLLFSLVSARFFVATMTQLWCHSLFIRLNAYSWFLWTLQNLDYTFYHAGRYRCYDSWNRRSFHDHPQDLWVRSFSHWGSLLWHWCMLQHLHLAPLFRCEWRTSEHGF